MTADIINLRRARKTKTRRIREQQAAENRALYGRSKAERARDKTERCKSEGQLDGARREAGAPNTPGAGSDDPAGERR